MDSRFVRRWHEANDRRSHGEPFPRVLASMSSKHLIEALAGAAAEDPVAANAIATAALNRIHRARWLGAFTAVALVGLISGILLIVADFLLTGTFGIQEQQPMGLDVAAVGMAALVLAFTSTLAAWIQWRRYSRHG